MIEALLSQRLITPLLPNVCCFYFSLKDIHHVKVQKHRISFGSRNRTDVDEVMSLIQEPTPFPHIREFLFLLDETHNHEDLVQSQRLSKQLVPLTGLEPVKMGQKPNVLSNQTIEAFGHAKGNRTPTFGATNRYPKPLDHSAIIILRGLEQYTIIFEIRKPLCNHMVTPGRFELLVSGLKVRFPDQTRRRGHLEYSIINVHIIILS